MTGTRLAELTTLGTGGPARRLVTACTEEEIIGTVREADAAGERLLIVGGGSNLVIDDAGFDGTVLRVASTGHRVDSEDTCGGVFVRVAAGHPWDDLVKFTVLHAYSGLEALSGIPGSTGATPVQNVGAYGTDVSATIASVRCWDRETDAVRTIFHHDLAFGYRDSLLKRTTVDGSPRYVVLTVDFQLAIGRMSVPIRYTELARALDVAVGAKAYATDVRRAVLRLRAGKGMVLDREDRDTFSTGSFFTNPIVSAEKAAALPDDAPRYPAADGMVKLSAAWLIDRAGFGKGFGLPGTAGEELAAGRAGLSTKHTLAVTNRGGASTGDVLTVARAVRDGVRDRFGIDLHPEPLLIGTSL